MRSSSSKEEVEVTRKFTPLLSSWLEKGVFAPLPIRRGTLRSFLLYLASLC